MLIQTLQCFKRATLLRLCVWLSRPVRAGVLSLGVLIGAYTAGIHPVLALNGFSPENYITPHMVQQTAAVLPQYGQGVFYAPPMLKIYAAPNIASPLKALVCWQPGQDAQSVGLAEAPAAISSGSFQPVQARNVFLAYYPNAGIAILPVVAYGENDWVEVAYLQRKASPPSGGDSALNAQGASAVVAEAAATGWVQVNESDSGANASAQTPAHYGRMQSWQSFMRLNGRKNGVYWLSGVGSYAQALRREPEDTAPLVPVTAAQHPVVMHVKGNWMLVEMRDFGQKHPMGWLRWRDEQGQLLMFVNFAGVTQAPLLGVGSQASAH
ncbi:MAG: hypothetical protein VKJ06_08635 [Vampirovibrionales bacterium]|nr:hypothetical protein [Vampirovibrionales bacterium]